MAAAEAAASGFPYVRRLFTPMTFFMLQSARVFIKSNPRTTPTGWLVLLAGLLALAGCASSPPKPAAGQTAVSSAPSSPSTAQQIYKIGPNDLLQIDVYQVEALSREARVNGNGEISMPLIGAVVVQNLSVQEAQDLLREKLKARYLQDPQVTVTVKEYTNQRITVEGRVKKPGVYSFKGGTTLLQVIALSQGEDELGNTREVRLFRENGKNEKESYVVNLDAIRKGEVEDPVLQGNDIIVVQEDAKKSVWKSVKAVLNRILYFGMSIPLI